MSRDVSQYCWEKMRGLAQDFRLGKGSGEIFECSYLTYLEVSEKALGRDPLQVWDSWLSVLKDEGTDKPLSWKLGETTEGREELTLALERFSTDFLLPHRQSFSLPPPCVVEVEDTKGQPSPIELLFGGDQA